ncbi:MAG TPA: hypothetical protein VH165_34400 [Kofleriaceae bacterium]|jgi:hypothetical protein|nr:hypothetical protein [Kofleriaceae bacterium]
MREPRRALPGRAPALASGTALVVLAATGCSPYDPSLPATPFLCGTTEPKCPDGYRCVADGTRMVCALGAIAPDAGFACADDSAFEGAGNSTLQTATALTFPLPEMALAQLAICPAGDKDTFSLSLSGAQRNIDANTQWDTGQPINLELFDATGASLATGLASGDRSIQLTKFDLAAGTYYLQTSAAAGVENNYGLAITVSGP